MKSTGDHNVENTKTLEYTDRLIKKQRSWWKLLFDVQAPYRLNLRRLNPGFTLDIGCGIGRNLLHLNGQGIGIDHNFQSVAAAKKLGLTVFTPEEFQKSIFSSQQFDSLLLSHVAEHMTQQDAIELLKSYIHLLRLGGELIIICPQEAGYKSDSTHVEFMDFSKLNNIHNYFGLKVVKEYSFPFPRFMGTFFTYNEFISVGSKNGE